MTEGGQKPQNEERQSEGPPIDFTTFVLSLSTSAFVQLGVTADGKSIDKKDLPMAKQTIDLIAMLEEKTKGNLTGEEERLLSEVLFDLRMRYAQVEK